MVALLIAAFAPLAVIMLPAMAATPGLDVNDVSILVPLDKKGFPCAKVNLGQASSSGEPIIARAIFDEFARAAKDLLPSKGEDPAAWRLTALRFDPCADSGDPLRGCVRQLRLGFQVLHHFDDHPREFVSDDAIHLIFELGPGLPAPGDPIVADLLAIKRASADLGAETTGRPLDVHPGLARDLDKKDGSVVALVESLVLRHARSSRLVEIAYASNWRIFNNPGGSSSFYWSFLHGPVAKGHWSQSPIFNVAPEAGRLRQRTDSREVIPAGGSLAPAVSALSADTPLAVRHRIANPMLTSPKTADCASCHVVPHLLVNQSFAGQPDAYRNPAGVTGFAELARKGSFFRAFGYMAFFEERRPQQPVVTSLAASSSARAADAVNASQGWANPSLQDCGSPAVAECFASRESGGTAKKCLKLCVPR